MSATSVNSAAPKPRVARAGVPIRSPEETIGGRGSKGTALRLTVMPIRCSRSSACCPSSSESRRSTRTRCTSVPPLTTEIPAAATSSVSSRSARMRAPSRVRSWRSLNAGSAASLNATALAAITCSSGPPCWPGNTAVLIFLAYSVVGQDDAAARAAEGLVRGGGDDVGVRHRVRVQPGGDQAGEVRHVHHQVGAHRVGDPAELGEVQLPGVGGPAGDDQLGPVLEGQGLDLGHVDQVVVLARRGTGPRCRACRRS